MGVDPKRDSAIMGVIAEFRGSLVNVAASDEIVGYSLDGTLADLFDGTACHAHMTREYETFLLITAENTSERRDDELFRRYVNALAASPQLWFRLRDCDVLARFTIAAALACNDLDEFWFTDDQVDILTEIGDTLYDAVAFYKHRAEGETNNTFTYMPADTRVEAFRVACEVLWALDVASARRPDHLIAMNFVRFFGGPIHMMRRYRFVEEKLSIGSPEDDIVIQQTGCNFKLWNRMDAGERFESNDDHYNAMLARQDELMFRGFADCLQKDGDGDCSRCCYWRSYGVRSSSQFGGVKLCDLCRNRWRCFLQALPDRDEKVFPDIDLDPALPGNDSLTLIDGAHTQH